MLSSSPFNKNTLLFLLIQLSVVHIIPYFVFVLIDSIFCFWVFCFISTMDSNYGLNSFEIIEPWFSISIKLLFKLSANVDMGWVGAIGYYFIETPTPRIGFGWELKLLSSSSEFFLLCIFYYYIFIHILNLMLNLFIIFAKLPLNLTKV